MKKRNGWKAYIYTLLLVLTAASLSLSAMTLSRYAADATVLASGRVAKWDVQFLATTPTGGGTNAGVANSVAYLENGSGSATRYFYVQNNSDVAAKVTPVALRYSSYSSGAPSSATAGTAWGGYSLSYAAAYSSGVITNSDTVVTVQPGGRVAYAVTITSSPAAATNATYALRFFAKAEQVD